MRVEQLMCRDVQVVSVDGSLADAARVMWENDCGCVPVVDGKNRIVGMITDRDICMAAYLRGHAPSALPVAETMSSEVRSCGADHDVKDAERLMQTAQIRRLPVTDGAGHVVGILSLNDIARAADPSQRVRGGDGVSGEDVAHTLGAICRPWRTASASA